MSTPQALEAATKDLKFQFFLARCFGTAVTAIDPASGTTCTGYSWRGALYVTKITEPLTPPK